MTTKRQAPTRRGNRRRPDNATPTTVRRTADVPPPRGGGKRGATAPKQVRADRVSRSRPRPSAMLGPEARPKPPNSAKQAKARAKARKAKAPKVIRAPLRIRLINRLASLDLRPRTLAAKVPFVVLIIGFLGVGLGVTLWLSTDAAERSYQLGNIREQNRVLLQQKEALERDVLQAQSAPALAEAARDLGMIPSRDTAHLIQDPTGNWVVVGSPKPADGAPAPPLNTKLPDEHPAPTPAVPKPQAPVSQAPPQSVEVPVRIPAGIGDPTAPAVPVPPGSEVPLRAPGRILPLDIQHLLDGGPSRAVRPDLPPTGPAPGSGVGPAPGPAVSPPVMPGPSTQRVPAMVPPAGPPAWPPAGVEQFNLPLTPPIPEGLG